MIPFFDTHYRVQRPLRPVFDFLTDFSRYFDALPEFQGCRLETDQGPVGEGKIYQILAPGAPWRTRVELREITAPERFVYDYYYLSEPDGVPLTGKASPMPWDWVRLLMSFEPIPEGTQVRARMQVEGVSGLFAHWRVARLKAMAARAQPGANQAMVRVIEQALAPADQSPAASVHSPGR